MGAKTWMIVYADSDARAALSGRPRLDRDASARLAASLFPKEKLRPLEDGSLLDTCPPDRELCIGCFPGVSVVAAKEFGIDRPSQLPTRFVEAGGAGTVTVHAMHSVVDWFAFGHWRGGSLVRALSLSPDSGIVEDMGPPLPFEEPYWTGQHPAVDGEEAADYPFPFHPLDLGEAALAAFFGYQLEGLVESNSIEPEDVPLARFERVRSLWSFWK